MPSNIKRIVAFIIDIFIVSIIAGALSVSPLNPDKDKAENYRLELEEITVEYMDRISSAEDTDKDILEIYDEFRESAVQYNYDIARNSVYEQIITVVCMILYYCLFANYFESQTVGKRLMKLRIETKDGNTPSLWILILRMILLFRIPISILSSILCFILNAKDFYDISSLLTIITTAYSLTLICMALWRKDRRGLHDLISGTKVEMVTKQKE